VGQQLFPQCRLGITMTPLQTRAAGLYHILSTTDGAHESLREQRQSCSGTGGNGNVAGEAADRDFA